MWLVGWLVVFNVPSKARSFKDGMSLAKDVKLDKYTVPTGNQTPGRRMAVHYVTAEPRKLHVCVCNEYFIISSIVMNLMSETFGGLRYT